jgi:hypothetical protein
MKKKKSLFARLPFFVLIFSVYPSLALLATNIREVEAGVVIRPFLVSLASAVLLLLILQLFFKDWLRTSFMATAILILFFTYGHITRLLTDRFDPTLNKLIQIIIYLLFFILLGITIRWILRKSSNIIDWTAPVNIVAIVLILFPLMQISGYAIGTSPKEGDSPATPMPEITTATDQNTPATNPIPTNVDNKQYPDVYLIVLDGYSRADTLKVLGYDNSEFVQSLEDLGFYVAQCSRSNYRHTLLSMSSTFSMDLLWRAIPNGGPTDHNAAPLYERLIHNPVRSDFEQRGYTTVAFQTGYKWDQWTDADYYLVQQPDTNAETKKASPLTPFEYLFLKNTAIYPFIENSSLAVQRYYGHYKQVNFTLDELPKVVTSIPGPKFVYAHIMSPHTPYIFLPDGSLNTDSRFYNTETGTPSNPKLQAEGYINNIQYLNSRMVKILDEIIKNSKISPIIILQGDHGYVLDERRFNNLMAFHFPNGGNASLYPTITPVNTFRLISNLYFGTDLPLRNDVSNDADVGNPYIQRRVPAFPETCP